MNRKTVLFSGNVQGVGFRYTAQHLAAAFNLTGYVKNLPDGRVQLVIEGPEDQLDGLIQELHQRMRNHIRDTSTQISPATGEFSDFAIRF
jgi:acylphosphatase